jgi:uncharacterized membrane protein
MIIDAVISSKTTKKATSNASEKTVRSIAKTISWRIIGTLDTMMIAWILTGELSLAFSIGSIEVVSKMILYFMHERAWNSIKWGK